jgi:hypothetical protein
VTYPEGKPGYALPPFFQIMILQDSDKNWVKSIKIALINIFTFQSRLLVRNIAYFGCA